MNRTSKFIQLAGEASQQSGMKPRVGAVLTQGSRVIKTAYNTPGKPRFVGAWSRHAEVRATINVNADGGTVYVYREHGLLKDPLLAKPCEHCMDWLAYVGVSQVVYTVPEYPFFASTEI